MKPKILNTSWKTIQNEFSVIDIQNFIRRNEDKLSYDEKNLLENRIIEMREANKKFAEGLINTTIYKMAVVKTMKEDRELSRLTFEELVADDKLYNKYKNKVLKNSKTILDRLTEIKTGQALNKTRTKSKRR